MMPPSRRAITAEHHRTLVAALTAIAGRNPQDHDAIARMVKEESPGWRLSHIGFLYRQIYEMFDVMRRDQGDTWPDFIAGFAAAGQKEYGE